MSVVLFVVAVHVFVVCAQYALSVIVAVWLNFGPACHWHMPGVVMFHKSVVAHLFDRAHFVAQNVLQTQKARKRTQGSLCTFPRQTRFYQKLAL